MIYVKNKYSFITILLLLLSNMCFAQNDILLSQQLFSRINYNPAATGASNYLNASLFGRTQWLKFEDGPQTQVLNVSGYIPQIKSGMGLVAVHDILGMERALNMKLFYAYHIPLSDNSNYISIGLSAGFTHKWVKLSDAIYQNPSSIVAIYDNKKKLAPDFDFGVEYNTLSFLFGASLTHISNNPNNDNELVQHRQLYLYSRYSHKWDKDNRLESTLSFMNTAKTSAFEANLVYYKSRFWGGSSLRTSEKIKPTGLTFMVGAVVLEDLKIGYSYEIPLGKIGKYAGGTHEIMVSWRLKIIEEKNMVGPRFVDYYYY